MTSINSLAVFASNALNTAPNSFERRKMLSVLEKIFQNNSDNFVLGIICDILAERSTYGEVTYTGKHAETFKAFFNHNQGIANMREEVCAWVKSNANKYPQDDWLNLADLGCGDGQAISQIIKYNFQSNLYSGIKLFLNDMSKEMLIAAEQQVRSTCANIGATKVIIHASHNLMQELEMINELREFFGKHINKVIIIAIASIHHMPYNKKIIALERLAVLKPRFLIIADANSEHDVHNLPKSPEIIECAMRFYNSCYNSFKHNGASTEILEATKFFLGSEARNVIMNSLAERIDYHTTIAHWKEVLEKSGFVIVNTNAASCYLDNSPIRRINATHFDLLSSADGESLCFSIGAKPI